MKISKEEMLSCDIWIWGARNMGPIVARRIISSGGKIKGFIDNSKEIQNSYIMNFLVYKPDDFYEKLAVDNIVLCCCVEEHNNNAIIKQLAEQNIIENVRILDWNIFDGIQVKWGNFIESGREKRMISKLCCREDFEQQYFKKIQQDLNWENSTYHRKIWEFAYIINVLEKNNMLIEGKRGIGFAVGEEPLSSYFASKNVNVLATDLGIEEETADIWVNSGQNAAGDIEKIWKKNIVSKEQFDKYVSYRDLDMNHIPNDIGTYDFCWSSCAIEHVGGLKLSKQFLKNMLDVLKPGGIAVHTTEFNLDSNESTLEDGFSIIYRKKDLEEICEWIREQGHEMELSFKREQSEVNMYLPMPPYNRSDRRNHLNLMVGPFASTSYGIVIKKSLKV